MEAGMLDGGDGRALGAEPRVTPAISGPTISQAPPRAERPRGGREEVNILRREFENVHSYSPIEHVRSRLKAPESLIDKVQRYGCELTVPAVRARVRDIAGIRITCSFVSDVYWIASMLTKQPDVTLVQTKDYIANPKPNGYRSLHLIVQVPVFLSDRTEDVFVEIQIRTIAMDFWASVEHKLFYKYDRELPPELKDELDDAARVAADLDRRMGRLRDEIRDFDNRPPSSVSPERAGCPGPICRKRPARPWDM